MQGIMPFFWVGTGGLIGSLCRFVFTLWMGAPAALMPWGTLTSNLTGCFVIGLVSQLATDTLILSPSARLFLATGFCGGFTTLSSLIYELIQMVRDGEWLHALLYLNGTFFGAVLAFIAGTACIGLIRHWIH
jgi:CrcB protein